MKEGIIEKLKKFTTSELEQEIKRRKVIAYNELINKTFTIICKYYNVTEASVIAKRLRTGSKGLGIGPVRNAKRALIYIFHHKQGKTSEKTGLIMNKNHSTCTVSANKTKGEMEVNPNYRKEINFLIKQING